MSIADLRVSADLCGPRISVRWNAFPDSDGAQPQVALVRKTRDFGFPADRAPYLIYDSTAFPPAAEPGRLEVRLLPGRTGTTGELRFTEEICSVARIVDGQTVEQLRRTVRTVRRPDRTLVRREIELLDAGTADLPLEPGRTYYYQLDVVSGDGNRLRASATPTAAYRYHRTLYDALPAVYRRADTVGRPADAGTGLMPEANASGGQLRRLIDVFGVTVGALRSSADGLRGLRDVDLTDARYLPLLAQWIGWNLSSEDIPRRRNEIVAAPARYRGVGTLDGLREIVEHYTGWSVRIGESAQSISRTNSAPQRNIFAAVERADGWTAPDDAAAVLGLSGASGREITGSRSEPFPMADAMALSLALDGAVPTKVRFTGADFAEPGAAGAAEVCAAIARQVRGLDALAAAGKVRLRSQRTGDVAAVAVSSVAAAPITLEGGPHGRISTTTGGFENPGDGGAPGWVAHATTSGPRGAAALRIKPRLGGRWYDAQPIGADIEPQADPAIVAMPARIWCAWVSDPATGRSRLRYRVGAVPAPEPARIVGDVAGPFALTPGSTMTVVGPAGRRTFTVRRDDYAAPEAATVAEVVAALNAQLAPHVQAGHTADGRVELSTAATGPDVTLGVDLAGSTAARRLGFGARGLTGRGGWRSGVDWGPACDVNPVGPGRYADCTAVGEAGGAVRLCWSAHDGQGWRLVTGRWSPHVLAATPTGLKTIRSGDITSLGADGGLPGDDVRAAVTDVDGTVWLATAAGAVSRAADGTTTTFTVASTGGGLLADDVRTVAAGPDGSLWFGTASGLSGRHPGGDWESADTSNGLPSNDIRAVVVTMDETLWVATADGVAVRRNGSWRTIGASRGLPTPDTRRLAVAADGAVWVATGAGVATIHTDGTVAVPPLADLPAEGADVRDLACDGSTVWLATAAGVVEVRNPAQHTLHTGDGAPGGDCRAITVSDGRVWVGAGTAILTRGADGRWTERSPDAGPVVTLTPSWSAAMHVPGPGAGEREPHLARTGSTLLLASARRVSSAADAPWQLALRRREPGDAAWSEPTALTTADAIDRDPVLAVDSDGAVVVYFRSNRGGGIHIWRTVPAGDGVPEAVTAGPGSDTNPAVLPDSGPPLLLFRSDRNVSLGSVAGPGDTAVQPISLRRYAGTTTALPTDTLRNTGRGTFDDLLSYTPQRPRGDTPAPDERYTPGTVAVFFGRGRADSPLAPDDAQRLRQLLTPFLPANVRAVPIADA